ncbi:MAG: uracil-DNA glycosylase [Methylococcales bacterium]|nr:uracil-DNA glycosylase [Methylococcales bacterium]
MDEATRLDYLKVMGIECWHVRETLEQNTKTTISNKMETTSIPDNWEQLKQDVNNCQQCELCQSRTQTVFGEGNPNADWLFIGEAPGEQEDLQGKPFVDLAGFLLTEMIRAIGLTRESVFIANILKCRPPDDRDPKAIEIITCHDYLSRQKALISPKIMVAVGRGAAQKLLKTDEPLSKLRGVVHQLDNIPLVVVYHPAYLLRRLSQKQAAWQDLQLALKTYQKLETV